MKPKSVKSENRPLYDLALWLNGVTGWHLKSCGGQSDELVDMLLRQTYDTQWDFSLVETLRPQIFGPFHQFIIAHSTDPTDDILVIDPFQNSIYTIQPGDKYIGILMNSTTFVKPAGNSQPQIIELP